MAIYINDLHIMRPDFSLIVWLKKKLATKFKTTDLGSISDYLSMKVLRKENTITLTQTVYIDQLLAAL